MQGNLTGQKEEGRLVSNKLGKGAQVARFIIYLAWLAYFTSSLMKLTMGGMVSSFSFLSFPLPCWEQSHVD